MRILRRALRVACAPIAALFLVACCINVAIVAGASRRICHDPADAPHRSVAVILGAGVLPGGRPSLMFVDRLTTGLALYKEGKVDRLLLSGDGRRAGENEIRTMERFFIGHGVPEDFLIRDPHGLSTFQSLRRARDVFGYNEALLVTQGFHLPRALLLARRLEMDAVGIRADRRIYPFFGFGTRVREFFARIKDWAISRPG